MSENKNYKASDEERADQWMREAMAGHRVEPAPQLWKGISRKLLWREILRFNFTNLSLKHWMAGVSGLLLVTSVIYFGVTDPEPQTRPLPSAEVIKTVAARQVNSCQSANAGTMSDMRTEPAVAGKHPQPETALAHAGASGPSVYHTSPSGRTSGASLAVVNSVPSVKNSAPEILPGFSPIQEVKTLNQTVKIARILPLEATMFALSTHTDTIITISNASGVFKFRKTRQTASGFFSANLGITPELAFYEEPEVYSRMNYWLSGGITWHISRFSVATGLNLGYVFDQGKYKVEYKSNDSIGYFTGVVSYTIGPSNEILFNTQTVNVYDSLNHAGDYRTKNRYTYLQIPLLAGYRFFESGKFSITFQAGPAIALLLGSRKSDPVIEYANARIIRVDDDTPSRLALNWQVWANLYCEMRLTRKIGVYFEPSFKYYLKPMVTSEDIQYKAPWTIGLGIGVQFNFGQKPSKP